MLNLEVATKNLGEDDMKKLSMQIGVGLMLGIGTLLVAAPQAKAETPCPKNEPSNSHSCPEALYCDPPHAGSYMWAGCYDTDGDCQPESSYDEATAQFDCVVPGPNGSYSIKTCEETRYYFSGLCA
jgi:hypothetical protein